MHFTVVIHSRTVGSRRLFRVHEGLARVPCVDEAIGIGFRGQNPRVQRVRWELESNDVELVLEPVSLAPDESLDEALETLRAAGWREIGS